MDEPDDKELAQLKARCVKDDDDDKATKEEMAKQLRKRRVGIPSTDQLQSLHSTLQPFVPGGLDAFVPKKRLCPGNWNLADDEVPFSKRLKLHCMADREGAGTPNKFAEWL